MSWSASFTKPVKKAEALDELDKLSTGAQTEAPAIDQCRLAKIAVRELLLGIPGPYVTVSINGHANGVGWKKKEGWANDCISVTVTQMCEEDVPLASR